MRNVLYLLLLLVLASSCEETAKYDSSYTGIKSIKSKPSSDDYVDVSQFYYLNGELSLIENYNKSKHVTNTYISGSEINCRSMQSGIVGIGYSKQLYYEDGRLVKSKESSSSLGPQEYAFHWENGKIVQIEDRNGVVTLSYKNDNVVATTRTFSDPLSQKKINTTVAITYDDKKSHLTLLPFCYRFVGGLAFNVVGLSKNNPLKVVTTRELIDGQILVSKSADIQEYTYTYNASGYPVEIGITAKSQLDNDTEKVEGVFTTTIEYSNIP